MFKMLSILIIVMTSTTSFAKSTKHENSTSKTKKKLLRSVASVDDGTFNIIKGNEDFSTAMAQLEVNLDKCVKSDNQNQTCIIEFEDYDLYSLTTNKLLTTKNSAPECILNLTNTRLVIAYSGKAKLKYKRDAIGFYATCLQKSGFKKTNTNPRKNIYSSKKTFPFITW